MSPVQLKKTSSRLVMTDKEQLTETIAVLYMEQTELYAKLQDTKNKLDQLLQKYHEVVNND